MSGHAAVPPHGKLNPSTLPNGTVDHSYSKTITASGGSSPYSFIASSGSLPAALTLTSGGVISGTPTSSGSFTFAIQATDRNGCPGTRQYNVTVTLPTITLSPATLPNGTVGHSYNKNITASGGSSPYSFIVSSGNLPAGLTLTSGGVLSGTPTSSGSFTFAIQADDSNGYIGTRSYSLVIAPH